MSSTRAPARRGPKPDPRTRERLLQAGVSRFHVSGYHATGISDIVAEARVPKGSFYNHFPSKERFGAEAVDRYFAQRLPALRAILEDERRDPLERLRDSFVRRSEQLRRSGFTAGCMLGNLSLELADHSDEIRERLESHFDAWGELIEHCIAQAQAAGSIRSSLPAPVLARFLLNSWEGALLRARTAKRGEPLDDFFGVAFDAVLS